MRQVKTALQITMSHVNNYGSVLQAYALQRVVESVPGWECKNLLIPPSEFNRYLQKYEHQEGFVRRNFRAIRREGVSVVFKKLFELIKGMLRPQCDYVFRDFVRENLNRTENVVTRESLYTNPPIAHLYVTGSDQTLNPKFTHADPIWFFDFVDRCRAERKFRKIAYAASIAMSCMSPANQDIYRQALASYDSISLREGSGVDLAREMGVQASHCVDPTVLLGRDFWRNFSKNSNLTLPPKFILCYNLTYYVNPYPMARQVERAASRQLGVPIIYLDCGFLRFSPHLLSRAIPVSVRDFVSLFFNASLVLTSSYHGTIFSLLAGRPFVTYVAADNSYDSRAADLLNACAATHHAMQIGMRKVGRFDVNDYCTSSQEQAHLANMRKASMDWLKEEMRLAE